MIAFETIFRLILVDLFRHEGDIAFIPGRYPHQSRADTRSLRFEIAEYRTTTTVATDLLVVKTMNANCQRF